MALQDHSGILILGMEQGKSSAGTQGLVQFIINAADEKFAMIFRVGFTGKIQKVFFLVDAVAVAGDVTVSLQTVSLVDGNPTGTLLHASATALVTVTATGLQEADFGGGNGADVTRGDLICVVIDDDTASTPDIAIATLTKNMNSRKVTYLDHFFSAAWTKAANRSIILLLEMDDGTYAHTQGVFALSATNPFNYNNTDTPDHAGLRFKVPFPCTIIGGWVHLEHDGAFDLHMFDSDATTILDSKSFDPDQRFDAGSGIVEWYFDTVINILADTFYRCIFEPTDGVDLDLEYFDLPDVASMSANNGGPEFHWTTSKVQTQESDWTQILTRAPLIGLYVKALDDGAGGGGMMHPAGWQGGFDG